MADQSAEDQVKYIVGIINDGDEDPTEALTEAQDLIEKCIEYVSKNLPNSKKRKASESDEEGSTNSESDNDDDSKSFYHDLIFDGFLKIAEAILDRRFRRAEWCYQANRYLQSFLSLAVLILPIYEADEYFKYVCYIFDSDSKFYEDYIETENPDGSFAVQNPRERVSDYLVENINFFGEKGGFDQILVIVKNPNKRYMDTIAWLLKATAQVECFLRPEFLSDWAMKIKDAYLAYVRTFSSQDMKETNKKAIDSSIEFLETLLLVVYPSVQVGEWMETFRLDVAKICMNTESLEKRMNGLMDINELINRIQLGENKPQRITQMSNKESVRPTLWLQSVFLLDWITDTQILESIYGNNIHDELVSRSFTILKFMTSKNRIELKHLEMLWNSAADRQETLLEAIYKVIGKLSAHLGVLHIDYLLAKIKTVPFTHWDERLLNLMNKITSNAIDLPNYAKQGQFLGLDLLWTAIQDDSGFPKQLFKQAITYLIKLLCSEIEDGRRDRFLHECLKNLSKYKSVSQSLKILRKLVEAYGEYGAPKESNIIDKLHTTYDLLTLVFNELLHYKQTLGKRVSELRTSNKDTEANKLLLPHKKDLEHRMKFLVYIVGSSHALVLNQEHLNTLWDLLIANALTIEEQELGFQYLMQFCNRKYLKENEISGCKFILEQKIASVDFVGFSESAFQCFDQCFRMINIGSGKISPDAMMQVHDFELTGLNLLWKIALNANSEVAQKLAIPYLLDLQGRLSPGLRRSQNKFTEQFLRTIMKHLGDSMRSNYFEQQAERCLTILKMYADYFDQHLAKREKIVNVSFDSIDSDARFVMRLNSLETIGSVKKELAGNLGEDPSRVILSRLGFQITDDSSTLEDLNIQDRAQLIFSISSESEADPPEPATTPTEPLSEIESPAKLLSSEKEYFQPLFNLLEVVPRHSTIEGQVWNLINSIPVNKHLIKEFLEIEKNKECLTLLDDQSPLKFLYYVKNVILDEIIEGDSVNSTQISSWKQAFEESNGLEKLYNVFMTQNFDSDWNIVVHLIRALNKWLLGHEVEVKILSGIKTNIVTIDTSSKFVKKLDLDSLIKRIMSVMTEAASRDNESVDLVIETCSTLLCAVLTSRPDLFSTLALSPQFMDFFTTLLVISPREGIRKHSITLFKKFVYFVKPEGEIKPIPFLLKICTSFLPKAANTIQYSTTAQYFRVFCTLVSESKNEKHDSLWEQLANTLVNLIRNHPVIEVNEDSAPDQTLIGLINLLASITNAWSTFKSTVATGDQNFIEDVFDQCLAALPNERMHGRIAPPKCKTHASKEALFTLLTELSKENSINYLTLLQIMHAKHESLDFFKPKWDYSPMALKRAHGYVGLKNLGCTCYMNSLIQQLFMIPRFRKGILSLDCDSLSIEDKKDNVVYQLQNSFGFLQESARQFHNPAAFCATNKDYEGNTLNVAVQMDVDEYFNMLCEKLDDFLKPRIQRKLLDNTWCGKLTTQLICKGCPHRYERDDPFYTISLDIKNKKDILEALELYVKGEMLQGDNAYTCEKCKVKRDTLKRSCIKTLPNTMILNLKRFKFDLETMTKVKLNDFCKFPMSINMEPYTTVGLAKKEGQTEAKMELDEQDKSRLEEAEEFEKRPASYYEYDLVGILVHRGTSESGHYYSFIKERKNSNTKDPQWLEFNDKIVQPFDAEHIGTECFGGTEEVTRFDPVQRVNRREIIEKSRSAYLLIYERRQFQPPQTPKPQDLPVITKKPDQIRVGIRALQFIAKTRILAKSRKIELWFTSSVPKEVHKSVWDDNKIFLNQKTSFDPQYHKFMLDFIKTHKAVEVLEYTKSPITNDLTFNTIEFAVDTYLLILAHSRQKEILPEFITHIKELFSKHHPACIWFVGSLVSSKTQILKEYLIESTSEDTRSSFTSLLVHATRCLLIHEEEKLIPREDDMETEENSWQILVHQLVQLLLEMLSYDDWEYRFFDQYFRYFCDFMNFGDIEIQYLLLHESIEHFISFFAEDENLNGKRLTKRQKMKRRGSSNNFNNFVTFLDKMIRTCSLSFETENPEEKKLRTVIYSKNFLSKLFKTAYNRDGVVSIIAFMLLSSSKTLPLIVSSITRALQEVEYDSVENVLYLISQLCGDLVDDDEHTASRAEVLMNQMYSVIEERKSKAPRKTRECIKFILELGKESNYVRSWLESNRDKLVNLQHYLQQIENSLARSNNP